MCFSTRFKAENFFTYLIQLFTPFTSIYFNFKFARRFLGAFNYSNRLTRAKLPN